jgi:NAD/NADP transhydrogenase beta subunit
MMSEFASTQLIEVTYLIATALFILSLKWMSSPATAHRGVWAGELGMLLAIAGTLLHHGIVDYKWLAAALVLGTIIGVPLGKVAMTAVPQRTEPYLRHAHSGRGQSSHRNGDQARHECWLRRHRQSALLF